MSEPVTKIKGIGNKTKEDLALMDIETIEDLLFYLPYRHDVREVKALHELEHNSQVTMVGQVYSPPQVVYGGKTRTVFNVIVDGVTVRVVFFFRIYRTEQLKRGTTITLIGKWDAHRLQLTANTFKIGRPKSKVEIESLYSVKGNMTMNRFRTFIKQALQTYGDQIEEFLPESYLHAYKLPERKEALRIFHFPKNEYELKHARRRFIYEELLIYQLKIHLYKEKRKIARKGMAMAIDDQEVEQFIRSLPFTLTASQARSVTEIMEDLKSNRQMYRLLQGDVGSGKTAVAAISLQSVATAGYQGALMVPTEILAEQHYHAIQSLTDHQLTVALLTSSITGKERQTILEDLREGKIDVIIGTHSLIQEEVVFRRLGLVVIDEQHRFGVEQRRLLLEKGEAPDVLHMTATPIPRTLAITAFGDLDISTINELPSGRKKVETYVIQENLLDRLLKFIEKKVNEGEQVYFVSPLIEESEAFDYENAIDLYDKLVHYYPEHISIGLLHGQLKNDEKEAIMKDFVANKINILVSTTVIEVGVNVPNATIMVIYDAERFGLSQLHQLRGRVGRGDKQSYCILIAEPKGEVGKERMRIIAETTDGFALAEADLKLRGPGDFFGKKQSGLPEFKVADPVEDFRALEVARTDALAILESNRLTEDPAYQNLNKLLKSSPLEQFD